MRKTKRRFLTISLLFLISLGFLILKNKWSYWFPPKTNRPFSKIKKENITRITLTKDSNTTVLYKRDKNWYLKKDDIEYKADKERINRIIDAFVNLEEEEIVSKNKKRHKGLGIGKDKISIKTGEKTHHLYIGNPVAIDKNYLRIDENPIVFTGSGFSNVFYPEDFRDLKVHLIVNEDSVSNIHLAFNNQTVNLKKTKKNWYIKNKKVKKEAIDFFLNDLKTLKAEDILVNQKLSLTQPLLTIKITENGREKTAQFFPKDKDSNYLKTSQSKNIFEVSATTVNNLKKKEKDFLSDKK